MGSAELLIVDRRVHAAEIARFPSHVDCGSTASDCNIWAGATAPMATAGFIAPERGRGCAFARHRYALAIVSGVVRWGARASRVRQPGVRQGRRGDRSPPARRFGLAGRHHGPHGADAPWRRPICGATLRHGACGANGRWRCVKRCATAGMTLRCRRCCWVVSPPCGEIRQCPLKVGEHVVGCGELGGVGRGVAAAS